jgi:hypothetical protein
VTARPKQIVIDKSAFIALTGAKFDILCDFSKHHLLLLPDALLYECVTAKRQKPLDLLRKYQHLATAGAYYCSMSRGFIEWEAWYCRPYPDDVRDLKRTKTMIGGSTWVNDVCNSGIADRSLHSRLGFAERMLVGLSETLGRRVHSECPEVAREVKKLPADRSARLCKWLAGIDRLDIHAMALESIPLGWIRVRREFCLSCEWMTWQYIRLLAAVAQDYYYLRETGGIPGAEGPEHDYQDVECVLLLSRADGVITTDKRLVEPLARVAFPEKRVFSSLEEVPESYRCDGVDR